LKKLDELFKEKTEENYNKGLSAHKSKDYKNALRYWSNVIQMYPDFKGVKTDYDAILVIQVEKSRHFYQTGLVYEGLNNLENAFSNWQKALDELPVESSEYNRKASAKLAEYGK
jgi:tetratricopeptide (TPR) repeat protein